MRSFFLRTCAPAMAFGDRFVISSERLGTPVISETAWRLEAMFLPDIVTSLLATGGCAFRDGGGVLTKLMGLRGRLFEGHLSKKTERADKFHVRILSDFQVHTILVADFLENHRPRIWLIRMSAQVKLLFFICDKSLVIKSSRVDFRV